MTGRVLLGRSTGAGCAQVVVLIVTTGPWCEGAGRGRIPGVPGGTKHVPFTKETIAVSGEEDDFFDAACLADIGRTRPG